MSHSAKSPLPQVAYSDGPEVLESYPHQAQAYPDYEPTLSAPRQHEDSMILGLRRPTFWLCLILTAVVVIAGVGGGVGGSLAVQNAKSKAESNSLANAATTLSPSSSQTSASATALPPSSTSRTPGSTYTPIPPSEVDLVKVSCPSTPVNITILRQSATFTCQPGIDYVSNDITGLIAYTLEQRLQSCLLSNVGHKCVAVSYPGNMREAFSAYEANCWLATNTTGEGRTIGWTGWKLDSQS